LAGGLLDRLCDRLSDRLLGRLRDRLGDRLLCGGRLRRFDGDGGRLERRLNLLGLELWLDRLRLDRLGLELLLNLLWGEDLLTRLGLILLLSRLWGEALLWLELLTRLGDELRLRQCWCLELRLRCGWELELRLDSLRQLERLRGLLELGEGSHCARLCDLLNDLLGRACRELLLLQLKHAQTIVNLLDLRVQLVQPVRVGCGR
jgi:hypothetical protein